MSLKTQVGLLAGAAALTLTGVSVAGTASNDDVAQRLAAAEAKIAAMEAANNQSWLTEQRSAEIKGLVQDVLADADTRSSLLQSGATSGYDNGFILGSADGNWLLRINFLMQQRFIYNNFDEVEGEGDDTEDDDTRYGFENTRSKLTLSGHLVNPSWFYRLDVNFGSSFHTQYNNESWAAESTEEGDYAPFGYALHERQNAYLGYDYGNGWRMKLGSMKLPFLREELVEAQHQLAVERSVLNYGFSTGYSDALAFDWTGERFRVMGAFSDGIQQGQTVWINGPDNEFDLPGSWTYAQASGGHADYALTGRAEFMLNGTWDQFNDFTSPKGGEMGILLGAAVHYQSSEDYPNDDFEHDQLRLTGDVSAEFGGANLYGALVWTDNDFGDATEDWNPWGWLVQGGFYLDETWELYARFEWIDWDDDVTDDTQIITAGVNKYFAGHNAKWTTDFGYGLNPVFQPANFTGWRNDNDVDSDGQWVIRTQLQIYF